MLLRSKPAYLIAAIACLAALGSTPAAAVDVDCSDPAQSITDQLALGETFIRFSGTCNESPSIEQDGTIIQGLSGDPSLDVIDGAVFAFGVTEVSLSNFTIDGSVFLQRGSAATFSNMTLSGNLSLGNTTHASIFGSRITGGSLSLFGGGSFVINDTVIDDIRGGIFITDGAVANFNRSPITNTDNGVFVGRNATLRYRNAFMGPALVDEPNLSCNPLCANDGAVIRLDGVVVEGATNDPGIGGAVVLSRSVHLILRGDSSITNTGSQPAVGVFNDSSFRQDISGASAPSTIVGGLQVTSQSYADIRAAAVSGDVEVRQHSVLRLGSTSFAGDPAGTSITGATTISQDSALVAEDPAVTINGSITCLDKQSSLSGPFGGSGKITKCRDFNNKKVKR